MENSDKIRSQTIQDFSDNVSSDSPSPGGGAVGAVVIAFAASCALKTITITLKHKKDESLESVRVKLLHIKTRALELADSDASGFESLMGAFRLGKSGPEEIQYRRKAIAAAAAIC